MKTTPIEAQVNPLMMATELCNKIITQQVFVVLASQPTDSDYSPTAVSYTCGFYSIPVIGLTARDSVFSDKVLVCRLQLYLKTKENTRIMPFLAFSLKFVTQMHNCNFTSLINTLIYYFKLHM